MTGRDMTDEQVRAELERIDPAFFGDFDATDWDAFFELAEDHENFERFTVMLAASQQALGEIAERGAEEPYNSFGAYRAVQDMIKIARTARKGG